MPPGPRHWLGILWIRTDETEKSASGFAINYFIAPVAGFAPLVRLH